jgi:hypothetical protein
MDWQADPFYLEMSQTFHTFSQNYDYGRFTRLLTLQDEQTVLITKGQFILHWRPFSTVS